MLDTNWSPSTRDLRQFSGIWLPLFIGVVGAIIWFRFDSPRIAVGIWTVGLAASVIGVIVPAFAKLVYVGLMAITFPIGWVVSHVVLAATYYLLFLPIGLVLRFMGRDPLDRGSRKPSYWVQREAGRDPDTYFRQF